MDNIDALVRSRRSVRTFDDKPLSRQDLEKLQAFMAEIATPTVCRWISGCWTASSRG